MFKITIEGKSIIELQDNIRVMLDALGEDPIQTNYEGIENYSSPFAACESETVPTPTLNVPHVYPIPDTPQEAHDQLEKAEQAPIPNHSPMAIPSQSMSSVPPLPPFQKSSSTQMNSPGETDSKGRQWHAGIHASSRSLNKDGTWRYKRNVTQEEIAKVEGDPSPVQSLASNNSKQTSTLSDQVLQGSTENFNQGHASAPAPPVPTIAVETPIFKQQETIAPVSIAPPSYDNIPIPAQSTKPAHTLETFKAQLIPTLSQLVQNGSINQPYIAKLTEHFGVKNIWEITKNPAQIDSLFEEFISRGMITRVG